jgi:hypothetical protein
LESMFISHHSANTFAPTRTTTTKAAQNAPSSSLFSSASFASWTPRG